MKKKNNFKEILSEQNKAREVQIRVIVLRLGEIDTLNEKFFSEILIESKWEEPLLKDEFENSTAPSFGSAVERIESNSAIPSTVIKLEKEFKNANKYWNPQTFVENGLNDPKQTVYYKMKKIMVMKQLKFLDVVDEKNNQNSTSLEKSKSTSSNNKGSNVFYLDNSFESDCIEQGYWIYEYKTIKGHFFEKLELDYFPLDIQDLSIVIKTNKSNREVRLVQNRDRMSMINSKITIDRHIWHLYQHIQVKRDFEKDDFDEDAGEFVTGIKKNEIEYEHFKLKRTDDIKYPTIMFQIRAARRSGYFFWNAFLLIFLITTAVFTTFAIDVDKPHFRLPTTATLLLTSITFRWAYSSRLLPTVNYLTSLDKYSIASLILIYLSLMWHGFSWVFLEFFDSKTLKLIDRNMLIALIFYNMMIHVILFIWLRSAYAKRKLMNDKDKKFMNLREQGARKDYILSDDELEGGENVQYVEGANLSAHGNYKRLRRVSTQFKGFFSNLSMSKINSSTIYT
jgi:hypothetical protein